MSLRSAKAKRTRITAEQERRRRAAWEKRFAIDLAHLAALTEQCLQLLRILEQRSKPEAVEISGQVPCKLPDDFLVQPIHRVASR